MHFSYIIYLKYCIEEQVTKKIIKIYELIPISIRSDVCASHACLPSYGRGHTLSIASIKAPYIEILSSILIHGCLQGLLFVSAFQSDTHMHEMEIVITGHVSPEYHLDQCVVFTIKQLMLCVSGI